MPCESLNFHSYFSKFSGFLILALTCTSLLVSFNNSPTNAQQASQPQSSCNSCCQGPAGTQGTPGIPGVPGTNGLPGSIGPKGDRGESVKGDRGDSVKGEKGDSGSSGLKGDIGYPGLEGRNGTIGLQGPPGKVGPRGIDGSVGPAGPIGVPGVKGQKGEMQQTPLSAFSAARSTAFTPSSDNQPLPFEHVHTNLGDDFDATAGRFTCETSGLYLFTYSIAYSASSPNVYLMKNDIHINGLYRSTHSGNWDVSTNSAILQLTAGDHVWIKCLYAGSEIFSYNHRFTTFSGALLYEI